MVPPTCGCSTHGPPCRRQAGEPVEVASSPSSQPPPRLGPGPRYRSLPGRLAGGNNTSNLGAGGVVSRRAGRSISGAGRGRLVQHRGCEAADRGSGDGSPGTSAMATGSAGMNSVPDRLGAGQARPCCISVSTRPARAYSPSPGTSHHTPRGWARQRIFAVPVLDHSGWSWWISSVAVAGAGGVGDGLRPRRPERNVEDAGGGGRAKGLRPWPRWAPAPIRFAGVGRRRCWPVTGGGVPGGSGSKTSGLPLTAVRPPSARPHGRGVDEARPPGTQLTRTAPGLTRAQKAVVD